MSNTHQQLRHVVHVTAMPQVRRMLTVQSVSPAGPIGTPLWTAPPRTVQFHAGMTRQSIVAAGVAYYLRALWATFTAASCNMQLSLQRDSRLCQLVVARCRPAGSTISPTVAIIDYFKSMR